MGKLKVFAAANIGDEAKTICRVVAANRQEAEKKACKKSGLPLSEILVWEDSIEE